MRPRKAYDEQPRVRRRVNRRPPPFDETPLLTEYSFPQATRMGVPDTATHDRFVTVRSEAIHDRYRPQPYPSPFLNRHRTLSHKLTAIYYYGTKPIEKHTKRTPAIRVRHETSKMRDQTDTMEDQRWQR
jgi:hypothetical protein